MNADSKLHQLSQLNMAFFNGENDNELIEAQAHVWNHTFNYIDSMSLQCAVQLGIFDIIHKHGQPMSLSDLVTALPAVDPSKTRCVYRLMRVLVHSGFFNCKEVDNDNEHGVYTLTHASMLLLKNEPYRASPLLLYALHPLILTPFDFLSSWFKNNDGISTPFDMAHGVPFYNSVARDSSLMDLFYEAMDTDSQSIMGLMLRDECKEVFERLDSLVDVGGGTGTMAKAISEAFPELECTVFDLPHVIANLQGTEKLHYVGGDMFEAIPPANAVLLKWILHNWNDEESIKILKRCKEAIPSKDKGGKVIIIDVTIKKQRGNDHKIYRAQILFDMAMMVLLNGIERTEKEWEKLFLAAGFSHYKIIPSLGLRSIIVVYP